MLIESTPENLELLAAKTGEAGMGLAGTVDEALTYLNRWTPHSYGNSGLFFQFVGQAEQMRGGVKGALEHMRNALDGFSQAVDATAQDLSDIDEAGAVDYRRFQVAED